MNAALGSAGVILGFVAALGGITTLGTGLALRRPGCCAPGAPTCGWWRPAPCSRSPSWSGRC